MNAATEEPKRRGRPRTRTAAQRRGVPTLIQAIRQPSYEFVGNVVDELSKGNLHKHHPDVIEAMLMIRQLPPEDMPPRLRNKICNLIYGQRNYMRSGAVQIADGFWEAAHYRPEWRMTAMPILIADASSHGTPGNRLLLETVTEIEHAWQARGTSFVERVSPEFWWNRADILLHITSEALRCGHRDTLLRVKDTLIELDSNGLTYWCDQAEIGLRWIGHHHFDLARDSVLPALLRQYHYHTAARLVEKWPKLTPLVRNALTLDLQYGDEYTRTRADDFIHNNAKRFVKDKSPLVSFCIRAMAAGAREGKHRDLAALDGMAKESEAIAKHIVFPNHIRRRDFGAALALAGKWPQSLAPKLIPYADRMPLRKQLVELTIMLIRSGFLGEISPRQQSVWSFAMDAGTHGTTDEYLARSWGIREYHPDTQPNDVYRDFEAVAALACPKMPWLSARIVPAHTSEIVYEGDRCKRQRSGPSTLYVGIQGPGG